MKKRSVRVLFACALALAVGCFTAACKEHEHEYTQVVTPPTCTERGYTTYSCACGESYDDNYVEALDHDWGEGEVTEEPTCTEAGEETFTCSRCGESKTEAAEALGHTPAAAVRENEKAATCEEAGSYDEVVYCSVCEDEISRETKVIAETGHSFTNYVSDGNATCTENGTETAKCDHCGETDTREEEDSAKGHTPGEVVCDEAQTCTVCGEELATAPGHDWDDGEVIIEPGCIFDGTMLYTCSRCEETYRDRIPAEGHTPGAAATCTSAQKCVECGMTLAEALGHSWNAGTVTKEPTCTETGVMTYTCSHCSETKTETITAKGHTEVVDPAVAPTCTTAGKTQGSHCSVCDAVLVEQEVVPMLEHDWGEGKVTKEPTCTEAGVRTYTCSRCGTTKTETVAAKGHTEVTDPAVAPTCTTAGKTQGSHCSVCGYVLVEQQEIAKLAHTYVGHVCSRCYAIEMVGVDGIPVGNTVAVHDPSIIVAYADADGALYPDAGENRQKMYFIFGTQLAAAYSYDMESWLMFTPTFYAEGTETVSDDYTKIFASAAAWPDYKDSATIKGNLWAPDIIYNKKMGKWCLYYSMSGDSSNFRSSIFMMTSDNLTGPYEFVDFVVFSGFNKGTGAGVDDYKNVTGDQSVPSRYSNNKNAWNNDYGVSCIDPSVLYDKEGGLWLNYGSWSGGIFLIKLDNATGLRDKTYKYGAEPVYEGNSLVSDPYLGVHIAGGWYVSGEGPYIAYMNGYYYLFLSYGFYSPEGGYNMRVFRSETIDGKYVDMNGNWAVYNKYTFNYGDNVSSGEVLMQNYKWSWWTGPASLAQGHNSVLVDGGKVYLIYHIKYDDGTAHHNVEVHELVFNADGWPLAAPFQKSETDKVITDATTEQLAGSWSVILHTPVDYKNLQVNTDKVITLTSDGKVTGAYTGTWSLNGQYITITIGNTTYMGVVMEQQIEGLAGENVAYTFTATNASTNTPLWGVKNPEGMGAAESVLESIVLPGEILASINLPTTGDFGTTITYSSDNAAVLSDTGVYTAPAEDTEVTLKVTVTSGDYSVKKAFTVKVLSEASANALVEDIVPEELTLDEFVVAKAAPLAGETVKAVPQINASTGVSLTFRVENISTDWDVIFRAPGKDAIVYLSVLNYLGVDILETAATLSPEGAAILEGYGLATDGSANWQLFLGSLCDNADKPCIATVSYNVNGSITFYRNGELVLTYAATTEIGESTVGALSKYMAEQVGSVGLEVILPVEDLIIGYAVDYKPCEHIYGAYDGDTATCTLCGATKVRVEVGEKMYEAELPVEQALTSPDPSTGWNDNIGFGQVALSGDFLIRYEWDNSRDPNYWDAWFELFDANNNWYTAPVMEPSTTQTVHGWGNLYTNVVVEVTCNGEPYTLPVGGTANAYAGHYIATAYRVGSTFTLKVVLERTDGDVVVVTRTSDNFTTDALTAQLNGNTNLLDNFTVTYGTLTEVQDEVLATDRTLGNENNTTPYTGTAPLWTGSISQGQIVTATGTATCNPNPTEGSNPPDRGVWNAPLPYLWTGDTASLNFRPDNWVNGDGSQETYGAFNFAITKTFQGFTDTSLNGTDWTTTLVNYYNGGEYGCTIVWDYTASDVIVITFAFDFDDVTYNQRYEIRATAGKTLLDTYSIGLGVDYACFKVDSITRQ